MSTPVDCKFRLTTADRARFALQAERLLAYVVNTRFIGVREAQKKLAIFRLAAVIHRLRDDGHVFLTARGSDNLGVYEYLGFDPQLARKLRFKGMHKETFRQVLLWLMLYFPNPVPELVQWVKSAKDFREMPEIMNDIVLYSCHSKPQFHVSNIVQFLGQQYVDAMEQRAEGQKMLKQKKLLGLTNPSRGR